MNTSVPVSTSARHIHLSYNDRIALFGNIELKKLRDLSQSGQYATTSTVTISTDSAFIPNVRVLAPDRSATQVEISMTDARHLQITPPIRLSGDLSNTPGITITAPNGNSIQISQGVIIAARHLHIGPAEAEQFQITDGQPISARFSGPRGGVLNNIIVRIAPEFTPDLHLDTDEANAFGVVQGSTAELLLS